MVSKISSGRWVGASGSRCTGGSCRHLVGVDCSGNGGAADSSLGRLGDVKNLKQIWNQKEVLYSNGRTGRQRNGNMQDVDNTGVFIHKMLVTCGVSHYRSHDSITCSPGTQMAV